MKTVLPWLLAIAALAGAYFFFSAGQKKSSELASLRAVVGEGEQIRDENDSLKKLKVRVNEIARLKKENEDVTKLRSEVQQLREDKQGLRGEKIQMTKQLQSVEANARGTEAAAQAQAQLQNSQAGREQSHDLTSEKRIRLLEIERELNDKLPVSEVDEKTKVLGTCIKNLQMIDSAKQQWALENKKNELAVPTVEDVAAYIKNGFPKCLAGGTYSIKAVNTDPTCSIPGHKLPE